MKKIFFAILLVLVFLLARSVNKSTQNTPIENNKGIWEFQSIDTMKYSRDPSAEKLFDPTFDAVINEQVKGISETGVTHIAIATPYDEKFLPMLYRWVRAARKYNLKVWFRGNFSGWEGWFGYEKIDRETHRKLLANFISNNPKLFEDGDVFSACPECENGGPGDPRQTGDTEGFKKFMISENETAKNSFKRIDKNVQSNYASMNLDVAKLIMDPETTAKMDGVVVIDHYIKSPEKLAKDAREIALKSGGKVVFGEFGAPIPDIHGELSDVEQAKWIDTALFELSKEPKVIGLSYWTSYGGSTKLWNDDSTPRKVVSIIKKYYKPTPVSIHVANKFGHPMSGAKISKSGEFYTTTDKGMVSIPITGKIDIQVQKTGYVSKTLSISSSNLKENIVLIRNKDGGVTSLLDWLGIDF